MRATRGLVDIDTSLDAARPALAIDIHRELASDLGIDVQTIGAALRPLVAGDAVTTWKAPDGENYDVTVRLPSSERTQSADLAKLALASRRLNPDGSAQMVPLRQIASLEPTSGAAQINRKNLHREVLVAANTSGRPAGDIGRELTGWLTTLDLPPGYRMVMGGSTQDLNETAGYAAAALALAVIFIYLILASQFGSFLQPVAIMMSLPLSLIGVFLALLIARSTLNIFSIIGFIMLMGLVTKNAILLVDFINHGLRSGMKRYDAVIEAGNVRLRPILMTTAAMIFGMLPLGLGLGEGGEQRAPMAHAVIGGLITSTLLTLVVVPVIYTYLDDFSAWARRVLKGSQARSAPQRGRSTSPRYAEGRARRALRSSTLPS
jgi:HAE1 family hydrophobic/amphiphilic exporter-1